MSATLPICRSSGRIRFRAADRARKAIDRALDIDPAVPASVFTRFDAARIMAAAEAVDQDEARADAPLAGVTVSIKDVFDEAGIVTTAGSRILAEDAPAGRDAEAVRLLKAAGAIPSGRTSMSEFAYSGLGLNPHFGDPGNIRDASRISGGSSSGSALSVALGIVDVALGSDTGGSVRIPAALNGLCGFKPTRSTVSRDGVFPLSTDFDSVGPIAATIEGCAAVHAVLSGTVADMEPPAAAPRLGLVLEPFCSDMDGQVSADLEQSLARLRAAGWQIEPVAMPFLGDYATLTRTLVSSEAFARHRPNFDRLETLGDPHVLKRIRDGGEFSGSQITAAAQQRTLAITAFSGFGGQYDAFLMPTVQTVAPLIADAHADFDRVNRSVLRNSSAVNFLDGCAATVPMQGDGQLATGLTLFAPGGRDWPVLALAHQAENLLRKNNHPVRNQSHLATF